jgi:hypothetical protein
LIHQPQPRGADKVPVFLLFSVGPASATDALHTFCDTGGSGYYNEACVCLRKTNAEWDLSAHVIVGVDPTPSAIETPDQIDETGTCYEVSRILVGVPSSPLGLRAEARNQLEYVARRSAYEHPGAERAWIPEWTGGVEHDELMSAESAGTDIGHPPPPPPPAYIITGLNGVWDIWADDGVTKLGRLLTGLVPMRVAPTQTSGQLFSSMTVTFTNGQVWLIPGPHSGGTWTPPP